MIYFTAVLSVSSLCGTWNGSSCRFPVVDSWRDLKGTFMGRPIWLWVLLLLWWWVHKRVTGDGRDVFHNCALHIFAVRHLECQRLSTSGTT